MPKVVLQNGTQHRITIPLALIRALGIRAGDKFGFKINGKGNLEMVRE